MPVERAALCGILLLDKPAGLSSNAALQQVRRLLGRPKAGHTGSLDPLATGMLPICIGEATKVAGSLLADAKGYTATLSLGARTDTGDSTGTVVERCPVPELDETRLAAALQALRGPQQQVPPMYSALKRDGQPLYKLARRGLTVERLPRDIVIYALELLEFGPATLRIRVECSKGTYIRVLAEDLGRLLGSCAHLTALRRDFAEPFRGEQMYTFEDLQALPGPPALLGADRALPHLPAIRLTAAQARSLSFGQSVMVAGGVDGQVRLYDHHGRFMGLGAASASGELRPQRLFADAAPLTYPGPGCN
jgi:tRNA pseudouridine55 synthase